MPWPRLAFRALVLAASVVGCGTSTPPSVASGVGTASASPTAGSSAASSSGGGDASAGTSPSAAAGQPVADPSLLAAVDGRAAGLTVTFDPDTTATELADRTLDPHIVSLATAIAVPTGVSNPAELVIVNVARLDDPGLDEGWFRGWRDSYDAAACAAAGGVTGHAESTVATHAVFIGSCANGVFTYHTRLSAGAILLSLTSIGPSRLGERLLDHLAP
ncbi:MAG TPA: hypothetical protein VFP22_08875 [Candidatus Limnocylindrales bacterium]|nr:hypothetical protein [Candidatus Limnocylindrales bacterium]